jgi:ornithine cyclodeaminase
MDTIIRDIAPAQPISVRSTPPSRPVPATVGQSSPVPSPVSRPPATAIGDRAASGQVGFLGTADVTRLIQRIGVGPAIEAIAERIAADYRRWPEFDKTPRVPAHGPNGVIELMPIADARTWAFKFVNGHPINARRGLPTVVAFGALARMDDGRPEFIADLTVATALRTAATSAVAARTLARPDAQVMAMIGNGAQSEFQVLAFRQLLGIRRFRLFDVDRSASARLVRNLSAYNLVFEICADVASACRGADIVTTATADKRNAVVIDRHMIGPGVHLNAIGGDSPGKTELDPALVADCDVFVEYTPQTRIEGEIQQMAADFPVTELWQLLRGERPGRRDAAAITLFDSVGFALEDFSVLGYLRDSAVEHGIIRALDLMPVGDDPRDLFGTLLT